MCGILQVFISQEFFIHIFKILFLEQGFKNWAFCSNIAKSPGGSYGIIPWKEMIGIVGQLKLSPLMVPDTYIKSCQSLVKIQSKCYHLFFSFLYARQWMISCNFFFWTRILAYFLEGWKILQSFFRSWGVLQHPSPLYDPASSVPCCLWPKQRASWSWCHEALALQYKGDLL